MPIYEYRCVACGHMLDALQKISDAPLTDCPECGKSELKRLISAPSFRLKGSGWYETDFKSDKERKRNLAETAGAGSKSESGDKAEAGGKSGPAEKPDSKAQTPSKKESPADAKKAAPKGKGSGSEAA